MAILSLEQAAGRSCVSLGMSCGTSHDVLSSREMGDGRVMGWLDDDWLIYFLPSVFTTARISSESRFSGIYIRRYDGDKAGGKKQLHCFSAARNPIMTGVMLNGGSPAGQNHPRCEPAPASQEGPSVLRGAGAAFSLGDGAGREGTGADGGGGAHQSAPAGSGRPSPLYCSESSASTLGNVLLRNRPRLAVPTNRKTTLWEKISSTRNVTSTPTCRGRGGGGWSAVALSRLTAAFASWVQAILLPQPPEWGFTMLVRLVLNSRPRDLPTLASQSAGIADPASKKKNHLGEPGPSPEVVTLKAAGSLASITFHWLEGSDQLGTKVNTGGPGPAWLSSCSRPVVSMDALHILQPAPPTDPSFLCFKGIRSEAQRGKGIFMVTQEGSTSQAPTPSSLHSLPSLPSIPAFPSCWQSPSLGKCSGVGTGEEGFSWVPQKSEEAIQLLTTLMKTMVAGFILEEMGMERSRPSVMKPQKRLGRQGLLHRIAVHEGRVGTLWRDRALLSTPAAQPDNNPHKGSPGWAAWGTEQHSVSKKKKKKCVQASRFPDEKADRSDLPKVTPSAGSEVSRKPCSSLSLAIPTLECEGAGSPNTGRSLRQAHRQPICHEQDQGGCDVDGEEGIRGPSEVLPLAAAEEVLMPWRRHRKSRGESQLLCPPLCMSQGHGWQSEEPCGMGPTYCLHLRYLSEQPLSIVQSWWNQGSKRSSDLRKVTKGKAEQNGGGSQKSAFLILSARLHHLGQGFFKKRKHYRLWLDAVAHTCNPSTLGG
ncbi:LOW QUALITY PROTEIN: hypothetical protein AAY473_021230 [Plecturocebus cupreus]